MRYGASEPPLSQQAGVHGGAVTRAGWRGWPRPRVRGAPPRAGVGIPQTVAETDVGVATPQPAAETDASVSIPRAVAEADAGVGAQPYQTHATYPDRAPSATGSG
ncbi:MAG: hypothetical protein MI924_31165 [Chloroflexales bacterium]|nr:hypothetical protein [Chloroflexales bacterium]